jgi:hypothetical protein
MRRNARYHQSAAVLVLLGWSVVGCSNRLTREHALVLVKKELTDSAIVRRLPEIRGLVQSPRLDGRLHDKVVLRVIEAELLRRSSGDYELPDVSGTFSGDVIVYGAKAGVVLVTLSQNEWQLKGQMFIAGIASPGPWGTPCELNGELLSSSDIKLTCISNQFPQLAHQYNVAITRSVAQTRLRVFDIRAPDILQFEISGNTSATVKVKIYSFAFTERMWKFMRSDGLVVGQATIESVDDLLYDGNAFATLGDRLLGGQKAATVVTERMHFNELGRAVYNADGGPCSSKATFARQQNGNWIVTSWKRCS